MSRDDVTIGIDIGTTAVKAVAADDNGRVTARVRIGHQLAVPAPDRLEHDADEAWRRGPLAALDRLVGPDTRALAVAAMVPSLTAVDPAGRPITPGLLYGDARGRVPNASVARAQSVPSVGETAEFLRWTAGQALDASGYWPRGGGQLRLVGRSGHRLCHGRHDSPVVRRDGMERDRLRRLRCDR